MINIVKTPIDVFAEDPAFSVLCKEYEGEYIEDMPPACLSVGTYKAMDKAGTIHTFCAYNQGQLIGFLLLIMSVLPHYSVLAGIVESFFVAGPARKTGAGLKLLRTAEHFAKESGAKVFLCTAPVGSRMCKILPRKGYTEMDVVFSKRLV